MRLSCTGMVFVFLSLSISIFVIITHRAPTHLAAFLFFIGLVFLIRRAIGNDWKRRAEQNIAGYGSPQQREMEKKQGWENELRLQVNCHVCGRPSKVGGVTGKLGSTEVSNPDDMEECINGHWAHPHEMYAGLCKRCAEADSEPLSPLWILFLVAILVLIVLLGLWVS